MNDLPLRLREFAMAAYGSTAKLARALGVSPQNLGQYTNGRRLPGTPLLVKLYELGCDTTWLLTGNGEMYADNAAGRTLKAAVFGTPSSSVQSRSRPQSELIPLQITTIAPDATQQQGTK